MKHLHSLLVPTLSATLGLSAGYAALSPTSVVSAANECAIYYWGCPKGDCSGRTGPAGSCKMFCDSGLVTCTS